MIKAIPHIKQMQERKLNAAEKVRKELNWSVLDYNVFQFEAGIWFIDKVFSPILEEDQRLLISSPLFWGWWRNKWMNRDETVLHFFILDKGLYNEMNTTALIADELMMLSFWNKVEDFIDDGERYILKEVKA